MVGILIKSHLICQNNFSSAVHFLGDDVDLLLDAQVEVVEELEVAGLGGRVYDRVGEIHGTRTSVGPVRAHHCGSCAVRQGSVLYQLEFRWCVAPAKIFFNFYNFV